MCEARRSKFVVNDAPNPGQVTCLPTAQDAHKKGGHQVLPTGAVGGKSPGSRRNRWSMNLIRDIGAVKRPEKNAYPPKHCACTFHTSSDSVLWHATNLSARHR